MFVLSSIPTIITTDQVKKSHANVKLTCAIHGVDHPKCKQAVIDDTQLYIDFMNQFKITDDSDDDTSENVRNDF